MSEIRVNSIVSETGTGNVAFNKGVTITGVVTASGYAGATITATGLTGTPDIAVQNITGVAATFTGAVTYEDVTNVDSIGIITARSGIIATGIVTATEFDGQTELRSWLFG